MFDAEIEAKRSKHSLSSLVASVADDPLVTNVICTHEIVMGQKKRHRKYIQNT